MSITQHGPICDVIGEYILLTGMQAFTVKAIPDRQLHVCDDHIETLKDAGTDFKALPDGPLRRAFERAKP